MQTLRRLISRFGFLESLYAKFLMVQSRRARRKGQKLRSIERLCTAQRHISRTGLTEKHVLQLRQDLKELFAENSETGVSSLACEFGLSSDSSRLRERVMSQPWKDAIRLRKSRDDGDEARQGNLIILKMPVPENGEKGVLLIKYNESISEFPAVYPLDKVAKDFRIILEPSYAGLSHYFFLYAGLDTEVFVQCPFGEDFDVLKSLDTDLIPIRLGAGDWVDESFFCPAENDQKTHDVVMVASWSPIKRHEVLFAAMKDCFPRKISAALIGYPLDWNRQKIEQLARNYGVLDQCKFFEKIPPQEVANVVKQSAVSLFLSLYEGASKVVYESLFCDTPVIIHKNNIGFNREHLCSETGLEVMDEELAGAITSILDRKVHFSPHLWATKNTGSKISTAKLNKLIRSFADKHNEPWTKDIVVKVNRPHLRYYRESDCHEFEPFYPRLGELIGTES